MVQYPNGTIAVAPEPGQMSLKEVVDQIAAMEASGGPDVTDGGMSLAALKAMVTDSESFRGASATQLHKVAFGQTPLFSSTSLAFTGSNPSSQGTGGAGGKSAGGARGMPGKKRGAVDTARRSVAISLTGRSTMFDQPRVGLRGLWRLHLCSQSVNEKKQADVSTSAATIAFANTLGAASNQLAAATIRADEGKAFVKAKKLQGTEPPPSEEPFLAGDTIRDRMMRALSRTSLHDAETGMPVRAPTTVEPRAGQVAAPALQSRRRSSVMSRASQEFQSLMDAKDLTDEDRALLAAEAESLAIGAEATIPALFWTHINKRSSLMTLLGGRGASTPASELERAAVKIQRVFRRHRVQRWQRKIRHVDASISMQINGDRTYRSMSALAAPIDTEVPVVKSMSPLSKVSDLLSMTAPTDADIVAMTRFREIVNTETSVPPTFLTRGDHVSRLRLLTAKRFADSAQRIIVHKCEDLGVAAPPSALAITNQFSSPTARSPEKKTHPLDAVDSVCSDDLVSDEEVMEEEPPETGSPMAGHARSRSTSLIPREVRVRRVSRRKNAPEVYGQPDIARAMDTLKALTSDLHTELVSMPDEDLLTFKHMSSGGAGGSGQGRPLSRMSKSSRGSRTSLATGSSRTSLNQWRIPTPVEGEDGGGSSDGSSDDGGPVNATEGGIDSLRFLSLHNPKLFMADAAGHSSFLTRAISRDPSDFGRSAAPSTPGAEGATRAPLTVAVSAATTGVSPTSAERVTLTRPRTGASSGRTPTNTRLPLPRPNTGGSVRSNPVLRKVPPIQPSQLQAK